MRFLDFFAGLGGFRIGMEMAGHECVGFCEYDEHAVASYTSMHLITAEQRDYLATFPMRERKQEILKEEYRNGEWYAKDIRHVNGVGLPRADIWCFGAPCFVGGTLITTSEGMKPIEDICAGDKVLTHLGTLETVLYPMMKRTKGIYTLKVMGAPATEVTGNHPVYIRYKKRFWNNSTRSYKYRWTEPEWKEVKDFDGTEYVLFPSWKGEDNPMEVTKEEAWLLGRYVADGYRQHYGRKDRPSNVERVAWCVGNEKQQEFVDHINAYGCKWHASPSGSSCTKYMTNSKRMFSLCGCFGELAHTKDIPWWIHKLPVDILASFLEGYLSGDGSCRKGIWRATTVSRKLALALGQCIQKVYGCPYSLHHVKTAPTGVIEGRVVNQRPAYQLVFRTEPERSPMGAVIDGDLWMPLREMSYDKDRVEIVYNMEVNNAHSYTANNMGVHNCQDFSIAGARKGLNGDRSSLVREVFRILAEIKEEDRPEWLIYENVKGMLSSNQGRDYLAILMELDELGYDAQWNLINSKDHGVPQNRERVYTVGHLRRYGRSEIFPIEGTDGADSVPIMRVAHANRFRRYNLTYDPNGITECLDSGGGGGHNPHVMLPEVNDEE